MAEISKRLKPLAPLSLDLDNKWSYLKTHGDESWAEYPSYLDVVVPRVLDFLERNELRITFFIVGHDATTDAGRSPIASIAADGHDIGNHSHTHEPWLHLYEEEKLRQELTTAHEAINDATGVSPTGFRGPGFSLSTDTLRVLAEMDYRYDATVFPNLLNPLGRVYYFMRSNLSREDRKKRKALFGTLSDAFQPNKPFLWDLDGAHLLELPVTTMPGLRIPIHFSYLIYLAKLSPGLAAAYFRSALSLCRARGVAPSLLLHPLDFLGSDDEPDLGFFPGMDLPSGRKLELTQRFVAELSSFYEPVCLADYVDRVAGLPTRSAEVLRR